MTHQCRRRSDYKGGLEDLEKFNSKFMQTNLVTDDSRKNKGRNDVQNSQNDALSIQK